MDRRLCAEVEDEEERAGDVDRGHCARKDCESIVGVSGPNGDCISERGNDNSTE